MRLLDQAAPVIGRQDEIALVDRLLLSPSAQVVDLVGEPGIGKTRLLAELGTRAERSGRLVLAGRTTDAQRDLPYGILIDALDDHLADIDVELLERQQPGARELLGTVFLTLAAPGDSPHDFAAPPQRYRLHRAIRALLEMLTTETGLMLMLDDAHWADRATIELLDHLLRHPPRAPLLIVIAYRPRQAPTALVTSLTAAVRSGLAHRAELCPLTADEVDVLFDPSIGAQQRTALYRQSGGNPGYLEALAAVDAFRRCGQGDTPIDELPPLLASTLVADFQALSSNGRLVAYAAAVVGDPFDPELVADVAQLSAAEVLRGIDELLDRDLTRCAAMPRQFRYRHPLLRYVGYQAASTGWRLGAHARAAKALGARHAHAPSLAHHLERAASVGDRASIAVLAEAAATVLATEPETAVRWLRAALSLVDSEYGAENRYDLLDSLATALTRAGHLAQAREALDEAVVASEGRPSPVRLALAVRRADLYRMLGRHADARAMLSTTNVESTAIDRLPVLLGQAKVSIESGRIEPRLLEQATSAAGNAAEGATRSELRCVLAALHAVNGDVDDAMQFIGLGAGIDVLADEVLATRLESIRWLATAEHALERYDDAARHYAQGVHIAQATTQRHLLPRLLIGLGETYLRLGRLGEAADLARQALDAGPLIAPGQPTPETGVGSATGMSVALALSLASRVSAEAGDADAALASAIQAMVAADSSNDPWGLAIRLAYAEAKLLTGDADSAVRALGEDDPQELPAFLQIRRYECLVRAELLRDHTDLAADWAGRAEDHAHRLGLTGHSGFAALARARIAARVDAPAALEPALAAATAFAKIGLRVDAGRAHMIAAAALNMSGDMVRAATEYARAASLFDECGALVLAEQARLARESPSRPADAALSDAAGSTLSSLSRREMEIAELVSHGYTNRQVARVLSLSHKTVETYLARIFAKLNVSCRASVAKLVGRAGLPAVYEIPQQATGTIESSRGAPVHRR